MTDLRIVIDGPAGLRVQPTGAYEGWALNSVSWITEFENHLAAEGALDPGLMGGGQVRAVAQVTGPEGQSETLMTPFVYVQGSVQSVLVDLDSEAEPGEFSFSFGTVEGVASSVSYHHGTPFCDARVVFSDGRGVEYRFDPSDVSVDISALEQDLFGSFEWLTRFSTFDAEGRMTLHVTEFDDQTLTRSEYNYVADQLIQETHINRRGLREDKYYEDGVLTSHQRVDQADAYIFMSDIRNYKDGILNVRNMALDNGLGISWQYEAGVLTQRTQFDHLDVHAYDNHVTFYDAAGLATSAQRIMDDGRAITFGYNAGVRSHVVTIDQADAFAWSEKTDFYGAQSNPRSYVTGAYITFDDGRHLYRRFEENADGEIAIRQFVLSDLADAYGWTSRERSYDETGKQTQELLTLDDGVIARTVFADDVRSQETISDQDDARSFTSVVRQYEEGELRTVTVEMDDGRLIERRFDQSELATVVTKDQKDAFIWAERLDTREDGELATRATLFDDGVIQNEHFDQGQRIVRERLDEKNAHGWHSITELEDGVIVSRDTVWDDDLIA